MFESNAFFNNQVDYLFIYLFIWFKITFPQTSSFSILSRKELMGYVGTFKKSFLGKTTHEAGWEDGKSV